jgi:hypothetical protein
MRKLLAIISLLFFTNVSFSQKQISGLLYDVNGNILKGVSVISKVGQKAAKILNDGSFYLDTQKMGVYDDVELIISKKGWHLIPSEDNDVLKIDPKSNRVIVTLQARARNTKQSLAIRMIKDDENASEILFYRIQLRATKQPITKETLAYLQKNISDLNVQIIEEQSNNGAFRFKYILNNKFESKSKAEEFGKLLAKRFQKSFLIIPYYN